MPADIRVDPDHLNARLAKLARIGATDGGGVTRLALTDEDRDARDLLRHWMTGAGLDVRVDDMGNMVGVRSGQVDAPPVLIGSHLDTVVRGGRYDGALGVLAGLEVIETLNDHHVETRLPIALVNWTNEEGVRFEPAMTASGVVAGRFAREEIDAKADRAGLRLGDELDRIGYRGDHASRPDRTSAYLELHIEQGPVLEAAGLAVGIVGGIVGITWSEVVVTGQADHAGPSPMRLRRDALTAAARIVLAVERLARDRDETAVATVGRLVVEPNVINTIPGRVTFSVDLRHAEPAVLEEQVAELGRIVAEVAAETGTEATLNRFWTSEPTPFAPDVLAAIASSAADLGLDAGSLWSGAGHDAKYLADLCPAGMIFVRSRGGLSHCEEEFSSPEDIAAGANILLHTALRLAR